MCGCSKSSALPDVIIDEAAQDASSTDSLSPPQDSSSCEHDVPYFRQLLVTETEKLQRQCDRWQTLQQENDALPEHGNAVTNLCFTAVAHYV